mgnify:CR=1 FL=1
MTRQLTYQELQDQVRRITDRGVLLGGLRPEQRRGIC